MKRLMFALILVCCGALLASCGGAQSGGVTLAKDNQTSFTIVNHLDDEEAARGYMTALLIKTGATFSLSDGASGHTIHIGTAQQLNGLGGTDPTLTYTQYEFRADGGNLYISLGTQTLADDVCTILRNAIVKASDGSFVLPAESCGIKNISNISEVIPMFTTQSGQMQELYDCGSNHYQITCTDMDKASADGEIAAYEQQLLQAGYTKHQDNTIGNSYFSTFYKGDTEIHCNYFYPMHEFRIVYGTVDDLGPTEPVTAYERVVEPTFSEIGMSASVQCNVLQLADGSYVVIDGGWGWDADLTYEYTNDAGQVVSQPYHRDAAGDAEALWNFLRDNAPNGEKPRVTWMITHADPDHITLPPVFIEKYADQFSLERVIYNFPNLYIIGLGESNGSTNDPATMTGYVDNFLAAVNKYFPDASHYVYHTGQKLHLPGCELEFLMAHEDFWPNAMPWMNDTDGAWRFTLEGRTILILGDCTVGLNNRMVQIFGDYLKSDVLQTAHHGSNGGTLALYRVVDPEVCFWTCGDFPFFNDNRHTGTRAGWDFNLFLRQNTKIKYHFTNSATHTLLISSLEER